MKNKLLLTTVTIFSILLAACGTPKVDANGNPLVKTQISSNGGKIEYEYNANGDVTKKTQYTSKGKEATATYKYGSNNLVTEAITYDANDKMDTRMTYEYEADNMIKSSLYSADNELMLWKEFDYDENGNNIRMSEHNTVVVRADDYFLYEYDADNNLTKETQYYSDDTLAKWTEYTYSKMEDGITLKLEVQYDKDGTAGNSYEYYYNSKNNLIKTVPHSGFSGANSIMEREYDEYGNVLRVISTGSNGKPMVAFEYTYEFY